MFGAARAPRDEAIDADHGKIEHDTFSENGQGRKPSLFLRAPLDIRGHICVERKTRKSSKGKAISILSAKIGRAVYYMLKNQQAFDTNRFFAA